MQVLILVGEIGRIDIIRFLEWFIWRNVITSTFRKFMTVIGISLAHENWHFGQVCLAFQYLCIIDCRIEAKGVTPIPVAISTAC